jgi:desulfoferrodoxin-like iron-binding protein
MDKKLNNKSEQKQVYQCRLCKKTIDVRGKTRTPPVCCNEPMEEDFSVCLTSDTAEHSRLSDMDEPCDDGRSGK